MVLAAGDRGRAGIHVNTVEFWNSIAAQDIAEGNRRERQLEFGMLAQRCRGSVFEFGCGVGTFSTYLPAQCFYVGCDISPVYVAEARQQHPTRLFFCNDLMACWKPFENAFETACAFQVLEHFERPIEPIHVLLKVARRIVFSVPRGKPSADSRVGDGHLYGWRNEEELRIYCLGSGRVKEVHFLHGNANHICGILVRK